MDNYEFEDYYKVLQVDRYATSEEISTSYKSLAKKYHPDLNLSNLDEANKKMRLINEAYAALNNSESRENYNLIYDSYTEHPNIVNDAHDSYISNKNNNVQDAKEYKYLRFKKRNVLIAIIAAIFLIYIIAINILMFMQV
jgi:curved DNA-binding protein CbpA